MTIFAATPTTHAGVIHEEVKVAATPGETAARLGDSVAIDGSIVVVGAPREDVSALNSGAAYVLDATTGAQLHRLTPAVGMADAYFGSAVAAGGGYVVVGAPSEMTESGRGVVYGFDAASGEQRWRFEPNTTHWDFGRSIAMEGTTVVAGSLSRGAWVLDAATGSMRGRLALNDPAASIGSVVALRGDTVLLVSTLDDVTTCEIFDASSGERVATITPSAFMQNQHFGTALAISDAYYIASGPAEAGYRGAVYLFDRATHAFAGRLSAPDVVAGDQFGAGLAASGDIVVVGAADDKACGSCQTGSAYVFELSTRRLLAKLEPRHASGGDLFAGGAVAISDERVIVGAPLDSAFIEHAGAAYVFNVSCPEDANGDGQIDFEDLEWILFYWDRTVEVGRDGDADCNGRVDFNDLARVLDAWGCS